MKRMHIIAGVAFALVFVVGAFGSRWLDAPDYRALCEAECSCTGCVVSQCMDKYAELGEEQEECRAAGDRIAACKLQDGGARCETGGGWTLYMPTELCRAELDEFGDCLEARGERRMAEAEAARPVAPELSFKAALEVMCEAPNKLDLDNVDASQRATELARYIEQRASNPEMEALFKAVATAPASARQRMVQDAVRGQGIEECAFLTELSGANAGPP